MSILSTQLPFDASTGQARLLGHLQQVSLRDPGLTGSGSFSALLLQQVMGACDRSSLALNETEGQIFPSPTPWVGLPTLGHPGHGGARAARPVAHRNPSAPSVSHPHQITHQAHRMHHPESIQAQVAVAAPRLDPAAAPVRSPAAKTLVQPPSAADGFLEKLGGLARSTAEALGLSPHLLLAQAALETGWGRKAIKGDAGQESYNLFGIKADKHWTGKTVAVVTTECINGVSQQTVASFRAYGSYAESFADYARLIKHRYGQAMAQGATAEGFGQALQAKGYATDPHYAQKIARVAQSVAYRLSTQPLASHDLS